MLLRRKALVAEGLTTIPFFSQRVHVPKKIGSGVLGNSNYSTGFG